MFAFHAAGLAGTAVAFFSAGRCWSRKRRGICPQKLPKMKTRPNRMMRTTKRNRQLKKRIPVRIKHVKKSRNRKKQDAQLLGVLVPAADDGLLPSDEVQEAVRHRQVILIPCTFENQREEVAARQILPQFANFEHVCLMMAHLIPADLQLDREMNNTIMRRHDAMIANGADDVLMDPGLEPNSLRRNIMYFSALAKVLNKSKVFTLGELEGIYREYRFRSEIIRHPNIVRCLTMMQSTTRVYLVFEFAGTLNLAQVLSNQLGQRCNEEHALTAFDQLVQALSYCHSKDVAQRNLSMEHLIVDGLEGTIWRACGSPRIIKDIPAHILDEALLGDENAEPPVNIGETQERLREMGQPITLFGETDMQRYRRLSNCEKEISEGKKNPDIVMLEGVAQTQAQLALRNEEDDQAAEDEDEAEQDDEDDKEDSDAEARGEAKFRADRTEQLLAGCLSPHCPRRPKTQPHLAQFASDTRKFGAHVLDSRSRVRAEMSLRGLSFAKDDDAMRSQERHQQLENAAEAEDVAQDEASGTKRKVDEAEGDGNEKKHKPEHPDHFAELEKMTQEMVNDNNQKKTTEVDLVERNLRAERKTKEDAERIEREAAEGLARVEAEKLAKEEEDRRAKEEVYLVGHDFLDPAPAAEAS